MDDAFYYVFFGMMVADLGYGALMAVATTIGLHALRLPKGTKRFLKLFQILSVPTMIWAQSTAPSLVLHCPSNFYRPPKILWRSLVYP